MRRSLILSTVLAVSTAVLGACEPKVNVPEKPAPTPVTIGSASPTVSPVASPVKPGASPEVKKDDGKNVNGSDGKIKEPKPAISPSPKTK